MLFRYLVSAPDHLCYAVLGFYMSESSLPHIGFTDGTRCSTQNLASATWAIYVPTNKLVTLQGMCLSRATKNIVEYSVVIELLIDSISLGIRHLAVRLNSQLVVL